MDSEMGEGVGAIVISMCNEIFGDKALLVMYNVSNERVSWRNGCLSKLARHQPPKRLLSRDSAHVLEKAGETFGICPPHTSHTGERIYSG